MAEVIVSRPATQAYRDGWERVFGEPITITYDGTGIFNFTINGEPVIEENVTIAGYRCVIRKVPADDCERMPEEQDEPTIYGEAARKNGKTNMMMARFRALCEGESDQQDADD